MKDYKEKENRFYIIEGHYQYRISNIKRIYNSKTKKFRKVGKGGHTLCDNKRFDCREIWGMRLKEFYFDRDGDLCFNFGLYKTHKVKEIKESNNSYYNWVKDNVVIDKYIYDYLNSLI